MIKRRGKSRAQRNENERYRGWDYAYAKWMSMPVNDIRKDLKLNGREAGKHLGQWMMMNHGSVLGMAGRRESTRRCSKRHLISGLWAYDYIMNREDSKPAAVVSKRVYKRNKGRSARRNITKTKKPGPVLRGGMYGVRGRGRKCRRKWGSLLRGWLEEGKRNRRNGRTARAKRTEGT